MTDKLDELLGRKPPRQAIPLPALMVGNQVDDPVETVANGVIGKILSSGKPVGEAVNEVYGAGVKVGREEAQKEIEAAKAIFGDVAIREILKGFRRDGQAELKKYDAEVRLITARLAHLKAGKDILDGDGFRFRTRPFIVGGARLRAHEVIEQIDSPHRDLIFSPGKTVEPPPKEYFDLARRLIMGAAKFDIRSLRAEDISPNAAFALELKADGLLCLPYPVCWFEWDIEPEHTIGCVAANEADSGETERIVLRSLIRVQGAGWSNWDYLENAERNEKLIAHVDEVCRAAMVILNSRSAAKTEITPPPRLNRRREKGNAPPLFSHTVVEIRGVVLGKHGEVTGRTHRSPRMHWRRGHLRHFRNAEGEVYRITPIAPMLVGSEKLGRVEHDYVLKGAAARRSVVSTN